MSLNIDINRIFLAKDSGVCPEKLRRSLILSQSCNVVNPGETVPLEFCRFSTDSIIISVAFLGSYSCNSVLPSFVAFRMLNELCRDITQNLRIRRLLCFENWWTLGHESMTILSKNSSDTEFCPRPAISSSLLTIYAVTSNICFNVRLSWFLTTFCIVEKFFPINVAAFNVVVIKILHIIECSVQFSAILDILFCRIRTLSLTLFTNSNTSLFIMKFSKWAFPWKFSDTGCPVYRE